MGWRTEIQIRTEDGIIKTGEIPIRRGIFQGDSFSPMWFCLAMNPLSTSLNENTECGFKIKITEKRSQAITHLLYMDDLKLYGQTEEKLHKLVKITKEFSEKIHMNFGSDKCSIQNIKRGKMEPQMKEKNELPIMSAEDVYK